MLGQLARKPFASQGDKYPEKSILRYIAKYPKILWKLTKGHKRNEGDIPTHDTQGTRVHE